MNKRGNFESWLCILHSQLWVSDYSEGGIMDDILDKNAIDVGGIGNYYGGLMISTDGDKFYWGIENWDGTGWDEIPESLYIHLMEFKS